MTLVWSSSAGALALQSPTANDPLLDMNTQPSLDLQFSTTKTLDDQISGLPLVDHQRDVSSGKSAGTYVDSDGLIKTSAVNLLTYSEEFDNAFYQKDAGVSVTPDAIQSPSGVLSADLVDVPGNGRIYADNTSVTGVCSVYIKAGTFSHFVISGGQVDLTVPSNSAGTITPVGDGWYRVVSNERTTIRHFQVQAYPDNTYSIHSTPGSYYLWGAQLETGSTATDYIPTTNLPSAAPRFDHDPSTGESLGLLIEESRTNSILNSGNWSSFATVKQNMATNATTTTAPDGVTTVSQIQSSSSSFAVSYQIVSLTAGTTYTISAFFKAGNFSSARLRIRDADFFATGTFDLSTGTASSGAVIQELPDGWYRCSVSGVATSTTSIGRASFDFNDPVSVGSTIYIWGAQLEAGSFPTSYIPTAGSAVTRAADVAEITGTNFSSWYNQSEGTISSTVTAYPGSQWRANLVMDRGIGATTRLQILHKDSYDRLYYAAVPVDITPNVLTGQPFKSAWASDGSAVHTTSNGSSVVTLSATIAQTMDGLGVGSMLGAGGTFGSGHIARLTYYPCRLGDTKLQEITS